MLAGGLSARMGRDKARVRLGSRTFLAHIRRAAAASRLPVRVIRRDLVTRCGPLGGVYTALQTSRHDAELFLACDMPFVSPSLLSKVEGSLRPKDTAVFVTARGLAGFPFLLRRDALPVVERQMARKQFSMQKLAQVLRARRVALSPCDSAELFNVNTPAELAVARRKVRLSRRPVACKVRAC